MYVYIYLAIVTCMFNVVKRKKKKEKRTTPALESWVSDNLSHLGPTAGCFKNIFIMALRCVSFFSSSCFLILLTLGSSYRKKLIA